MRVPKSIRALQYLPMCTGIVGQSVMSATVTCSLKSLLGEGSISLKDLIPFLSHCSDLQSCSNQCVSCLSSPSCSSWDMVFFSSCWVMNLICVIHALKIVRMVMRVTCCNLGIGNLKSCDVWIICNVTSVVCHSQVCGCVLCGLSKIIVSYFCGGYIYLGVVI